MCRCVGRVLRRRRTGRRLFSWRPHSPRPRTMGRRGLTKWTHAATGERGCYLSRPPPSHAAVGIKSRPIPASRCASVDMALPFSSSLAPAPGQATLTWLRGCRPGGTSLDGEAERDLGDENQPGCRPSTTVQCGSGVASDRSPSAVCLSVLHVLLAFGLLVWPGERERRIDNPTTTATGRRPKTPTGRRWALVVQPLPSSAPKAPVMKSSRPYGGRADITAPQYRADRVLRCQSFLHIRIAGRGFTSYSRPRVPFCARPRLTRRRVCTFMMSRRAFLAAPESRGRPERVP